jgi:hypothetical protein
MKTRILAVAALALAGCTAAGPESIQVDLVAEGIPTK